MSGCRFCFNFIFLEWPEDIQATHDEGKKQNTGKECFFLTIPGVSPNPQHKSFTTDSYC